MEDEPDGTVVLDVAGVGYELHVPLGTVGRAPHDPDGTATLFVHTHVREDALALYGFASPAERSAFRTLIGIARIGPKLAMAVLGVLSLGELIDATERGDGARLARVPGVGKKTADRMLLELKGKLTGLVPVAGPATGMPLPRAQASVVRDALVAMGFKGAEAESAVASLTDLQQPLEALVRQALGLLSR